MNLRIESETLEFKKITGEILMVQNVNVLSAEILQHRNLLRAQ